MEINFPPEHVAAMKEKNPGQWEIGDRVLMKSTLAIGTILGIYREWFWIVFDESGGMPNNVTAKQLSFYAPKEAAKP